MGVQPGERYVHVVPGDLTIEWLVVREHPDDAGRVLIVPIDDTEELLGVPDVRMTTVGFVARCGQSAWLPATLFTEPLRCGRVPECDLSLVRRMLADLARGRAVADLSEHRDDADPEYEELIAAVARAVAALESRSEP